MKRTSLLLISLALAYPAMSQTRPLPQGQIRSNGDIEFGDVLKLGRREAGKTILTPDSLRVIGKGSTGDISTMDALSGLTGASSRILAEKIFERLSINDFYRVSDGNDYLPAINRAVAALPNSGGTIHFPRRVGCYQISGTAVIGDGSANGPSTKQNIRFVGDTGSGTGGQTGFGADKGSCIQYAGSQKIAAILQFNGPMAMGLEGIVLEGGYLGYSATPTATTTNGSDTLTSISSMTNVVVGSIVTGPGIPTDTMIVSISGSSAKMSAPATATATITANITHNEATVDKNLVLNHVFRSNIRNVGLKNARIGLRQDSYSQPINFVAGANDSTFENIWCENGSIAGGSAGSGCFDIGSADATGILDVARNTYTNLTGIGAGDPNFTGLVIRFADNLTFRGGMMYSQRPWGLGNALAIIPPNSNSGREPAFPVEITFQGMAMIGRIYRDPRWQPASNGGFSIAMWPMHSGDMLDPHNPGKGTLPSFDGFTGVDDRGIFFGMGQFRSWLDNTSGVSVAYDTASTVSRRTTLSQVTGKTTETTYATHSIPGNAMRSRNSKDYPNGTFPLADTAQYAYDRVVSVKQSGNYFNNNTDANIQIIVRLGSTTIWQSGNINLPASEFYGAWRFEGELSQSGKTAQNFNGRLTFAQPGSANSSALPVSRDILANGESNLDLSGDQPITVSIAPSSTSFVWNAAKSIATIY